MPVPNAPAGTGPGGRRLWRSIMGDFELTEAETALLREAVRTVDNLDALADAVRRDGAVVEGKPHPALVESRQQRIVLARLVASLRLPDDDDERPQSRGAARGTYALRTVDTG